MSVEDAKVFLERLRNEPALLARLQAAKSDDESKTIMGESGLIFTMAEVAEARDADPTEMSDEQLVAISGGGWWHRFWHDVTTNPVTQTIVSEPEVIKDAFAHIVEGSAEG